jgi:hypothetical protein
MVGCSDWDDCHINFREIKASIFSHDARVQQAWDHLLLGRIKMINVDLNKQSLRVSVAGGLRDLMFWPGSHDSFNEDTLAERLGLPSLYFDEDGWLIGIDPHSDIYHADVGWRPQQGDEDWVEEEEEEEEEDED